MLVEVACSLKWRVRLLVCFGNPLCAVSVLGGFRLFLACLFAFFLRAKCFPDLGLLFSFSGPVVFLDVGKGSVGVVCLVSLCRWACRLIRTC